MAAHRGGTGPTAVGRDHGLGPVVQPRLHENPRHVRLDGRVRHDEVRADLGVGQSIGDQDEDLAFAGRQLVHLAWSGDCRVWPAPELLQQPPCHRGGQPGVTRVHGTDGRTEVVGDGVLQHEARCPGA